MKVFSLNFFRSFITFVIVFIMTFSFLFYFTHNDFRRKTFVDMLSSLMKNFVHEIQQNSLMKESLAFLDYRVAGERESLTEYKLTILSKSLDQYFLALLQETEKLMQQANFYQVVLSKGKWGSWKSVQNILSGYLKNNVDVLEFGIYSDLGEKVVGVKYQDVPDYELSEVIRKGIIKNKNVLIRHKQNKNLILLSSVTVKDKAAFFITQTLHPVFFSRILEYLEISEELFYVKNGDTVMIDNGDVIAWAKENVSEEQKKKSVFAGFYNALTKSNEKLVKLNTSTVDYRLGTVMERNNAWGNLFILGVISLFFAVNFYFIVWSVGFFQYSKVKSVFVKMRDQGVDRKISGFLFHSNSPEKKSNFSSKVSLEDMSFWQEPLEASGSLASDSSIAKENKKDSA